MAKSTTGSLYLFLVFIILLPINSVSAQDKMAKHKDLSVELIESAKNSINSKNYQSALKILKQAYILYPENPMVPYSIARAHQELGECEKAFEWSSKTKIHHDYANLKKKVKTKISKFIDANPQYWYPHTLTITAGLSILATVTTLSAIVCCIKILTSDVRSTHSKLFSTVQHSSFSPHTSQFGPQ